MKIIITYASAGAGHLKAAEAIFRYIRHNYQDIDAEILDVLDASTPFFRNSYNWGYNFLIRRAPFIWAAAFWLTSVGPLRFLTRALAFFLNHSNTKDFARLLTAKNADYIISTHFLASEIAARLKNKKIINSTVITVITDFGVHPFWLTKGTDRYIVASPFTKKLLIKEGIEENNIKCFGIPVDLKFSKSFDRVDLRQRLGIAEDEFTLLVMTGSFGIGPIEKIVRILAGKIRILAVCANNKRLFDSLGSKNYPGLKVLGFVDNVEELMAASDVMITKPGGLSISELLCMELAPVFICAIPGQEAANALALKEEGIGVSASCAKEASDIVLKYKGNPEMLKHIKQKIGLLRKPSAAKELVDAVCKGSI